MSQQMSKCLSFSRHIIFPRTQWASLSTRLPTAGLFHCFHIVAAGNNATRNVGVQISLQGSAFDSFGCISRTAGSHSNSAFNLLRNHQTIFHRIFQAFTTDAVTVSALVSQTPYLPICFSPYPRIFNFL